MAELKEELKKVLAETFTEMVGESTSEDLPETVAKLKDDIEARIELETLGAEFLDKLKDVAFSRKQLREAEKGLTDSLSVLQGIVNAEEGLTVSLSFLQGTVNTLLGKLDELSELKKSNLALERKVLTDIDDMLKKNK
jgi:hypothetical protein